MPPFPGFPEGKVRFTPIPAPFFSDLLPQIDSLDELKLTLYVFWRLDRSEGTFRYVRLTDFLEDKSLMQALARDTSQARGALEDALEKAVARGTLLKASITVEEGEDTYFFLNSPRGRAALEGLKTGLWRPSGEPQAPLDLSLDRPNIYRLYEEHIGPLTPMIAETLREADSTYPPKWIEDAIRIAVELNKRNWRYVEAILHRWQEEGRDERKDRKDTERNRRRYAEWESSTE